MLFFSVQKSCHTTHENYEKIMCIAILRGQFGRTPTALGLLQNELIIWILFKTIFNNYLVDSKGRSISKRLFDVFKFFLRKNKNKSTRGIIVAKSNFLRIFEELRIPKSPFEIN